MNLAAIARAILWSSHGRNGVAGRLSARQRKRMRRFGVVRMVFVGLGTWAASALRCDVSKRREILWDCIANGDTFVARCRVGSLAVDMYAGPKNSMESPVYEAHVLDVREFLAVVHIGHDNVMVSSHESVRSAKMACRRWLDKAHAAAVHFRSQPS